ncbi:hypothetical protein PFICI_08851 [Pestalotiopsis fici W106-1]|uniref:Heterokaryon incompatibility domain-containing protein n=1 Tax=Pestalotiopsis fici (strain W106-1 / CGMCC3.15140) TaxID=1229662 RepID=W3WYP4_PESFW|nr:uncharacterized protein PFICI_08851 [Pestalotiopsis fici W106-1]ETS78998.1 hypothetical protein PFICI_08851 [Pestalotiopsis fici W106-1]
MPSIYRDLLETVDNNPMIRLLSIEPATNTDDDIKCKLEEVLLLEAPEYESLSYCWGEPIRKCPIECNDTSIDITENLSSALRHLRHTKKHRIIWVDAICINQNDFAERSSQVLAMREIFQHARSVVIWLGPASANSSLAFRTLKQCQTAIPEVMKRFAEDPFSIVRYTSMNKYFPQIVAWRDSGVQRPRYDDRRHHLQRSQRAALRAILERPYWTRLWVLQEICSARELIVKCGNDTMPWDAFRDSFVVTLTIGGLLQHIGHPPWLWCSIRLAQLQHHHQATNRASPTESHALNALEFIAESHLRQTARSSSNIILFLELSSNLRCTLEHDKIYGILGLAQPPLPITPDYQMPIEDCFKAITIAILQQRGNLDLFSACSAQMFQNKKTLPSWVPDFSLDHLRWYLEDTGPGCPFKEHFTLSITAYHHWLLPKVVGTMQDFRASGPDSRSEFRLLDGDTLELVGHVVDEVAYVGPDIWGLFDAQNNESSRLFGRDKRTLSLRELLKQFLQHLLRSGNFAGALVQWEDLASQVPGKPTHEELLALLRVLQQAYPTQDMEPLLLVYNAAWRRLLASLRRIQPLNKLGSCRGFFHVYNLTAGLISYVSLRLSRNKAHFIPFHTPSMSMHRIAKTKNGLLVYASVYTQENDCIVLLKGGKTPFVARRNGHKWKLVGDCYVDGLMLGEQWSESAAKPMEFT